MLKDTGSLEISRKTLVTYQILGLIIAIVVIAIPFLIPPEDHFDPMWQRYTLGGLIGGLTLLHIFSPFLQRNTYYMLYAYCFLLNIWLVQLAFYNDLILNYSPTPFLFLVSTSFVFKHFKLFLAFLIGIFVFSLCLYPVVENPIFSPVFYYMIEAIIMVGLGILMDRQINERAALRRKGERQRVITRYAFEYSGDGILVVDPKGQVLEFNRRFLEMWPLDPEDLERNQENPIRNKMAPLVVDQETFLQSIEESYEKPEKQYSESVELLDGRFLERFSAALQLDDEAIGRIWFYRDLTRNYQEKQEEEEKRRLLEMENQALIELAGAIGTAEITRQTKFNQIAVQSLDVLNAHCTGVWLKSRNSGRYRCILTAGPANPAWPDLVIEEEGLETFFHTLSGSRALAVKEAGSEPATSDLESAWPALAGAAAMYIPLRIAGAIAGFIYVRHDSTRRIWAKEEIGFAGSLGDVGGVALESERRREAEKMLREKLAVLKSVFEMSGMGILVTSSEYKALDFNAEFVNMWGLTDEEVAPGNEALGNAKMRKLLANEMQADEADAFLKETPEGERFDIFRLNDGRIIERNTRPLWVEGLREGRLWFFRDITARVKDEEALRNSEIQNRAIVEAVPDLMIRMGVTGFILNLTVPEVGEYKEWLPQKAETLEDMFPEEMTERILDLSLQALGETDLEPMEMQMDLGGKVRDLEIRVVGSGQGEVLVIVREVTQRKAAERELIQRNFELDSFVYRASHDLKAPLNSLMGLIDILMEEGIDEDQLRYIKMMDRSVVKLDVFIRNLNDFSRIARLELSGQSIDFSEMISEIRESLRYMENADRVEVREKLEVVPGFECDRFHLEVILSNLISNAIKYQDHQKDQSWVEIRFSVSETEACIEVIDNGIGIPKLYQNRLFELFFRASNQSFGSGLGLYITQNAARKLGGRIEIESEEGEGTTFRVFIPRDGKTAG